MILLLLCTPWLVLACVLLEAAERWRRMPPWERQMYRELGRGHPESEWARILRRGA